MKILAPLLFICLILAGPALARKEEGGGSGNGGGSGVACFGDEAAAKQAIARDGRISEAGLVQLRSLQILDIWEWAATLDFFRPQAGETADLFLQRAVVDRLSRTNPYFGQRLKEALAKVRVSNWIPRQSALPFIQDQGDINGKLPRHCRLVQIIDRHWQKRENQLPLLTISVDARLLKSLRSATTEGAVLNLAALELHEAVYVLGTELGQYTSARTRKLTAFLLARELDRIAHSNVSQVRSFEQFAWGYFFRGLGFAEFTQLFINEGAAGSEVMSLRASYKSLSKKMRQNSEERFADPTLYDEAAISLYLQEKILLKNTKLTVSRDWIAGLTQEEAFLYFSSQQSINTEAIVNGEGNAQQFMSYACSRAGGIVQAKLFPLPQIPEAPGFSSRGSEERLQLLARMANAYCREKKIDSTAYGSTHIPESAY